MTSIANALLLVCGVLLGCSRSKTIDDSAWVPEVGKQLSGRIRSVVYVRLDEGAPAEWTVLVMDLHFIGNTIDCCSDRLMVENRMCRLMRDGTRAACALEGHVATDRPLQFWVDKLVPDAIAYQNSQKNEASQRDRALAARDGSSMKLIAQGPIATKVVANDKALIAFMVAETDPPETRGWLFRN